jgi:hypothetical protein
MEYQLLSRQRCIRIYGILASLYQIRSLTKTEHRYYTYSLSLRALTPTLAPLALRISSLVPASLQWFKGGVRPL